MLTENFHTHTTRCHHASGSDREYVETAIKHGIKRLGFSDHVPYDHDKRFMQRIRMSFDEAEGYFSSLTALKKEYAGDIEIFIGFESEYDKSSFPELLRRLEDYPVDYLILGQHFVFDGDRTIYTGDRESNGLRELEIYVDTVLDALATGCFTYLAHPDLISASVLRREYDAQMARICCFAAENDIPLEVNAHGFLEGRDYPSSVFWKLASDKGCRAVIGCDAHEPRELDPGLCVNRLERKMRRLGIVPAVGLALVDPFCGGGAGR